MPSDSRRPRRDGSDSRPRSSGGPRSSSSRPGPSRDGRGPRREGPSSYRGRGGEDRPARRRDDEFDRERPARRRDDEDFDPRGRGPRPRFSERSGDSRDRRPSRDAVDRGPRGRREGDFRSGDRDRSSRRPAYGDARRGDGPRGPRRDGDARAGDRSGRRPAYGDSRRNDGPRGPRRDSRSEGRSDYRRDGRPTRDGGSRSSAPRPTSARPGERRTSARIAVTRETSRGTASESTQGRFSAQWVRDDTPVTPKKTKGEVGKKPYALPADIAAEIRRSFTGSAYQRERLVSFMTDAAQAYDRHRYEEALRLAKNVALSVPSVASAQELAGLAAYRAERFAMARKFLRAAFELSGDGQHLPQVMDCERAARRYSLVKSTFQQLVDSEPTPDVLAEGRIVLASALADQSKFQEAIDLLNAGGAAKILRNPSGRHLRMWYTLADVYDRAGDAAAARELFARVVAVDPEAYDAYTRLEELGGTTVRKNRKKRTTPVSKKKNVD